MKFIHTADLHLDSPFLGLRNTPTDLQTQIMQSTFVAFEQLVTNAIEQQVDFIVIAGDIYDRDEHSIQAENFFIHQCEKLQAQQIKVYLSYGNHDYQQVNDANSLLPDNVYVFGNQVETKQLTTSDGTSVAISGFSYDSRWITDDRTNEYPIKSQVDIQIGMLHGMVSGSKEKHANYAPFKLAELTAKGYDYWALGHIHKREVLSENPWIIYSGNTQGRHKNEPGEKGYYQVELKNGHLVPEFVAIAPIIWTSLSVEFVSTVTAADLQLLLLKKLEEQLSTRTQLVQIILKSETIDPDLQNNVESGLLLGQLQRSVANAKLTTVWPVKIKIETTNQLPTLMSLDQEYWQAAAQQVFTKATLNQVAEKLFKTQFIDDEFNNDEALDDLKQRILLEFNARGEK